MPIKYVTEIAKQSTKLRGEAMRPAAGAGVHGRSGYMFHFAFLAISVEPDEETILGDNAARLYGLGG